MVAGDGGAVRPKLGIDVGGLWAPPAKMKAPKGASVFGEAPRAVV
jgi:hypothetical protein